MLKHRISGKVLKIFAQECFNDDLRTFSFCGKVKFAFIWEEVIDFGVNTDK